MALRFRLRAPVNRDRERATVTRIVTMHHRYKRPAKKRKAVAIAGPVIVRKVKAGTGPPPRGVEGPKPAAPSPPANEDRTPALHPTAGTKPAIVTARRPEEYQRRGDAADALWRELVRRATSKDRP